MRLKEIVLEYTFLSAYVGKLGRLDGEFPHRRDRVRLHVQDDVFVDVYWKDVELGKGPSISVFVLGEEMMKFDCFGKDRGHFHIAFFTPGASNVSRMYMPEPTIEDQIERAVFEIRKNINYYLQRNSKRRIRKCVIDAKKLSAVCEKAKSKMYEFIETVDN